MAKLLARDEPYQAKGRGGPAFKGGRLERFTSDSEMSSRTVLALAGG